MIENEFKIRYAAGTENFPELNGRQKLVLKEVCDSFISTGIPVGSRTLSRVSGISCSPATIRNEMADLESLGYLFSPHTSAGRIPTELGYRFYVNSLIEYGRLCQIEQSLVEKLLRRFDQHAAHQSHVLRSAVRFASEVTRLTGVVLTPQKQDRKLRAIQLVRLLEDQVMLLTVDDCGHIGEHVFGIPADTRDESLQRLSSLLNSEVCNRKFRDLDPELLREMQSVLHQHNTLLQPLIERLQSALGNPEDEGVLMEGMMNFFEQAEFQDSDKIRRMMTLLDRKENLLKILGESLENDEDVMVNIGSASGLGEDSLSLVTARYRGPNLSVGRIGIIGPTRMDYGRVVATLVNVSKALSALFVGPTRGFAPREK